MLGLCCFPAEIHPREAQAGTGSCHQHRCAPLLCPISCLAPQHPTAAPALTHSLHSGSGKPPWRLLPKIPAGFQLPLPMATSSVVPSLGPPARCAVGYSRVSYTRAAGLGPVCSALVLVSMSWFFLLLPQHLGCARSLISEAPNVKMGANLTKCSSILLSPPNFIILLLSVTMLSFPIRIPSGDSPLLENKSLPCAIKNTAVGRGSLRSLERSNPGS